MPDKPTKFNVLELKHRRGSTYTRAYVNNVGMAASFYDIEFVFGQTAPGDSLTEDPFIEDSCSITMSWEHAKALAKGLSKAVAEYEQSNGEIRNVPSGAVPSGADELIHKNQDVS